MRNAALLLLTATIWGAIFVAQSMGIGYMGPLTFNCVRNLIGGVVLLPYIWYFDRKWTRVQQTAFIPGVGKILVTGGVCCGVFLCLASNFQRFGIQCTMVGRAGFIIVYYIIIVLILGLFSKKKCSPVIVGAVALSVVGLYLLRMTGGDLLVNKGDLLMLACTALFAVYIMITDFFSSVVDGVEMSCIQFFVCGIFSGTGILLYETPDMGQILAVWTPVLYADIISCDVAYTLRIVGQEGADPTMASLILSLEPSISVLAGWAILNQKLTAEELTDRVLMFAVIILTQLLVSRKSAAKAQETRRHAPKRADP